MAQQPLFCTTLDVRNMSEYINAAVRDDARVAQFIYRADAFIRSSLRGLYTVDAGLLASSAWNGRPQPPFASPDHDIFGNVGDAELMDITPSSSAVTELWTLAFTSSTAFTVSGSVSGSQANGSVNSDYDNGLIAIASASWSGSPSSGDKFYIPVYTADPSIVAISALLSAGLLLKATYMGDGGSKEGDDRYNEGKEWLLRLQNPDRPDGMRLGNYGTINLAPEGLEYFIDDMGRDLTDYADNERTPWQDGGVAVGFSFLSGPVW